MSSDTLLLLQRFISCSCWPILLPWHVWASFFNLTTTFRSMQMLLSLLPLHSKHPHTFLSSSLTTHMLYLACITFLLQISYCISWVHLTRRDPLFSHHKWISVKVAIFKSSIFSDSVGNNQVQSTAYVSEGLWTLHQQYSWVGINLYHP